MLVAVKEASSIFVNQLNAKNLKSSKTQFQFQFELSLAQLSPSLFTFVSYVYICLLLFTIVQDFALKKCKKSINRRATIGQ